MELYERKLLEVVQPVENENSKSVFSSERTVTVAAQELPPGITPNTRLRMDGLEFLGRLRDEFAPVAFFDPQYRGVLDKLSYGNEGKSRGKRRSSLMQMSESKIAEFIREINRVLSPSGHLFLWMDKFHLCQGFKSWLGGTRLDVVDMVTWNKDRMGMGYRTRRKSEYCVVLQKQPRKAKGVWKIHNIPDYWTEKVSYREHPHQKPIELQAELISAVSKEGEYVIDPAAGSFSVMTSAQMCGRTFVGCDLEAKMAKLSDSNPRNMSGGYSRVFDDADLGLLLSKVQSTVISSGRELEKMIADRVRKVEDLDAFLRPDIMPEGVFLATKKQIKDSLQLDFHGSEPDFIVFKRRLGVQRCHIVELKDGHVFDTKKASAERLSMHSFVERNARNLPFIVSIHFCAFNQDSRLAIWEGFKKRLDLEETMTGKEFCHLLEIDYDEIVSERKQYADDNFNYFVEELLRIPNVKRAIEEIQDSRLLVS